LVAVAWATAGWAQTAPAETPVKRAWAEHGAGSLMVETDWGFATPDDNPMADHFTSSNPYALGIGLRGGYTFRFKLYVGAYITHHFGKDGAAVYDANPNRQGFGVNNWNIGTAGGTITTTTSSTEFGAQVGFDLSNGPIVLRPYLQDGILTWSKKRCFQGACDTFNDNLPSAGIGIAAFAVIAPILVGLDGTYQVVIDRPEVNGGMVGLVLGIPLGSGGS
jgi:hypothetical protein